MPVAVEQSPEVGIMVRMRSLAWEEGGPVRDKRGDGEEGEGNMMGDAREVVANMARRQVGKSILDVAVMESGLLCWLN